MRTYRDFFTGACDNINNIFIFSKLTMKYIRVQNIRTYLINTNKCMLS